MKIFNKRHLFNSCLIVGAFALAGCGDSNNFTASPNLKSLGEVVDDMENSDENQNSMEDILAESRLALCDDILNESENSLSEAKDLLRGYDSGETSARTSSSGHESAGDERQSILRQVCVKVCDLESMEERNITVSRIKDQAEGESCHEVESNIDSLLMSCEDAEKFLDSIAENEASGRGDHERQADDYGGHAPQGESPGSCGAKNGGTSGNSPQPRLHVGTYANISAGDSSVEACTDIRVNGDGSVNVDTSANIKSGDSSNSLSNSISEAFGN